MAKKKAARSDKSSVSSVLQKTAAVAAQFGEPKAPFRAHSVVEITVPLAGDIVKIVGESMTVNAIKNSSTYSELYATVRKETDTVTPPTDPDNPVGFTKLAFVSGDLCSGSVATPAGENDLKVVVYGYDRTANLWSDATTTLFTRAVAVSRTVQATSCLWFAWTNQVSGPYGEVIANHKPESIAVPAGVNKVEITAAGRWRHDPADSAESGPEGRSATDQVKQGYKDLAPNIIPLPDAACKLNLLVGMWIFADGGAEQQAGQEFAIGAAIDTTIPTSFTRPLTADIAKLYLGCHDGYQWNNNYGSVSAEVMFYTARLTF